MARQWVLLSLRVIAYYGLIRDSPSYLAAYLLRPRGATRTERFPNLLRWSVSIVPSSVPRWSTRVQRTVASRSLSGLRLLCKGSASTSSLHHRIERVVSRGCKVRFLLRPDRLAGAAPTCAFTFELSFLESPPRHVEYDYTGKQSIPVTGLAPDRPAALWAAYKGHEGTQRESRQQDTASVSVNQLDHCHQWLGFAVAYGLLPACCIPAAAAHTALAYALPVCGSSPD